MREDPYPDEGHQQQEEADKKATRLKEMEARRQQALQKKAEEEKARQMEEERRAKEEMERRKREREEQEREKRAAVKPTPVKKVRARLAFSASDIDPFTLVGRPSPCEEGPTREEGAQEDGFYLELDKVAVKAGLEVFDLAQDTYVGWIQPGRLQQVRRNVQAS